MKHEPLVNLPIAVAMLTSPWWLHVFETGSWFLSTLLPYLGAAVAVLQLYFLFRKFLKRV